MDRLDLSDTERAVLDAILVSTSDVADEDEVSGFLKSRETYHDRMGKLGFLLEVGNFTADGDLTGSLKLGDPTTRIVAQGGDGGT